MSDFPAWARKPKHKNEVVATDRGWVVAETGELLVSVRNLKSKLAEYLGVKAVEFKTEDSVIDEPKADEPKAEVVDEPKTEDQEPEKDVEPKADEAKDEVVDQEPEPEKEVEEITEPVKAPAKKRGRKPKAK